MANEIPLHLGYVLAIALHQQAITHQTGIISIGPYITRLLRGLNLLTAMDQVMIAGRFKPITTLTLQAMELFTPQGVIDNNLIITNSVTQSRSSAPTPTPILADSSFPDDSPFNIWLMRSLQKIVDHYEASSVVYSSHSCSIGVDTTDLKDQFF